jgi:hypothetical protein
MKKSITVLLLSIGFCISIYAQTKVISHKSHSGNKANFKAALNASIFDMSASNFGAAPIRIIRNAQLDSLIFLTDTSSVMITSETCWEEERGRNIDDKSIWKAGKDTLDFHPLFTKKHSLDSIKKVLRKQYNFQNSVDSIVFIGYDNEKPKSKPVTPQVQHQEQPKTIESKGQSTEKPTEKVSKKDQRKKRKAERKKRRKVKDIYVENTIEKPQVILASQHTEEIKEDPGYNKGLILLGLSLVSILLGLLFYKK